MKQQQQQQNSSLRKVAMIAAGLKPGASSLGSDTDRSAGSSSNQTVDNGLDERAKMCGTLFERKPTINQEIFDEFFRREPCLYNQRIYKNAARIFHCLKANLNENPILKSLKQSQQREDGSDGSENSVTEVPKIIYENMTEKKKTLELAFSTLRFQKVLEELLDDCQFYGYHPEFKDEQSLVCTILFDYMKRKFQLREHLFTPLPTLDNTDDLITQIEHAIHKEKTDLAAELAKNRIRADALTLEQLLPREIREVDQHRAELPLYCWVNPIRANTGVRELCDELVAQEDLRLVECKNQLDRKCFMVDPHCPNLLMFHYAIRDKIINHEMVKSGKLIIQDKSSCLAPYSVVKLLSKKDDVIVTNISGGLIAAFIGCQMEEFEGKVYVYGALNEEKYQELMSKFQQLGCSKYVKIMKEEFINSKADDPKLENVKVILINAPCSKTALMNPMEFLFQEGEDVRFLRDYTLDANNPNKIKKCIQEESSLLKHAFKFPKIRALIYQTYSKNGSENEALINRQLDDFNVSRRSLVYPYKITPPVIPLTAEDIQNDEVVKDFKFLQFKPSNKMNGCFIALLTRDRDSNIDKELQQQKKASAAAAAAAKKHSMPVPATFEEKNFLSINKPTVGSPTQSRQNGRKLSLSKKPLTNLRRKSMVVKKAAAPIASVSSLEEEIRQLQIRNQLDASSSPIRRLSSPFEAKVVLTSSNLSSNKNSIDPISFKSHGHFLTNFESRLANIGKLDAKKVDTSLPPNRSSTPDENQFRSASNNLFQPIVRNEQKSLKKQRVKFLSLTDSPKKMVTFENSITAVSDLADNQDDEVDDEVFIVDASENTYSDQTRLPKLTSRHDHANYNANLSPRSNRPATSIDRAPFPTTQYGSNSMDENNNMPRIDQHGKSASWRPRSTNEKSRINLLYTLRRKNSISDECNQFKPVEKTHLPVYYTFKEIKFDIKASNEEKKPFVFKKSPQIGRFFINKSNNKDKDKSKSINDLNNYTYWTNYKYT